MRDTVVLNDEACWSQGSSEFGAEERGGRRGRDGIGQQLRGAWFWGSARSSLRGFGRLKTFQSSYKMGQLATNDGRKPKREKRAV